MTIAIITLGNFTRQVKIKESKVAENGNVAMVAIDGTLYETHFSNIIMITEKE